MANYFNTINTALRALQAQQKSLDVTGHNIANANTEGYSRQRAIHTATDPYTVPGFGMPAGAGQVGTGVEIAEISRIRDKFMDGQINEEKQALGYWEKMYEGIHRIELIFNEPSDSSLSYAMTKFWEALQELSNSPEDPAVRESVKQTAQTMIDTFHNFHDQLMDYKRSLNEDVNTIVDEINSIARRIADLNEQIVDVKGTGKNPNDLLDRRDLLFEQLNYLVNVQGYEDSQGNLHISLGGTRLVSGKKVNELAIKENPDETRRFEDIIYFTNTKSNALIEGGELKAILDLRGGYRNEYGDDTGEIGRYLARLDELARGLVERFNAVHRGGYDLDGNDGGDFFAPTGPEGVAVDAHNISLSAEILAQDGVNKIAAGLSTDGIRNMGNGDNAILLAEVVNGEKIFNNGTATMFDFYKSMISTMGIDGQRADRMVNNQTVLVDQLENQRTSISGVSLDEEMANLIRFQQAYNAAARIITTTQYILDSLMGIIR